MGYTISGRQATHPVLTQVNEGIHNYYCDGRTLSSDAYFYRLVAGDHGKVKKMILLR
jgi:hypothetical protein